MLRFLGALVIVAWLTASAIGLAGGGPPWLSYVGTSAVFVLLLLILGQTSQLPDRKEVAEMIQKSKAIPTFDFMDPSITEGGSEPSKTRRAN